MAYFSDIAKRAINAAHGEKMSDWEGRKASDHHDSYSRDRYMPIEDANTRRTYRAKGGEIPEMEAKRGGRMHRADGGEDAKRRGGEMRRHRADGGDDKCSGGEMKRARGGEMGRPRDMYAQQGKGVFKPERDIVHCKRK